MSIPLASAFTGSVRRLGFWGHCVGTMNVDSCAPACPLLYGVAWEELTATRTIGAPDQDADEDHSINRRSPSNKVYQLLVPKVCVCFRRSYIPCGVVHCARFLSLFFLETQYKHRYSYTYEHSPLWIHTRTSYPYEHLWKTEPTWYWDSRSQSLRATCCRRGRHLPLKE
jgi:hypothetical protein